MLREDRLSLKFSKVRRETSFNAFEFSSRDFDWSEKKKLQFYFVKLKYIMSCTTWSRTAFAALALYTFVTFPWLCASRRLWTFSTWRLWRRLRFFATASWLLPVSPVKYKRKYQFWFNIFSFFSNLHTEIIYFVMKNKLIFLSHHSSQWYL